MAKRRKSGMRRAHLKRFSSLMVNGGRLNPRRMSRVDKEASHKMNLNKNSKSLNPEKPLPPTQFSLERYEGVKPRVVQNPMTRKMEVIDPVPPFIRVIEKLYEIQMKELWQGDFHQGQSQYNAVDYVNSRHRRLTLCFCGNQYVWLEENKILKTLRRSIVYTGKDRALQVKDFDQITYVWSRSLKISPPS